MLFAYCTLLLTNAHVSLAIGSQIAWTAETLRASCRYQESRATTQNKIAGKYQIPQKLTPPQYGFALANSASEIGVYWARTLDHTACRFNVYRSTQQGFRVTATCRVAEAIVVNRYCDNHLQANTTYYYRITSLLDGKESAPSSEFLDTTMPADAR